MSESATLSAGTRVRHRVDGRTGVIGDVVDIDGESWCTVVFPNGEWDLEASLLEPVATATDVSTAGEPIVFNPHRAWARREAMRLADAYRNDPSSALSNSRIEPKHHQVSVAIRALEKSQPRLILADEVGLGKTIEAGLILKELRARGVVDRVLIITPANLVTQWQHELSLKFNEHFLYANSDWINSVQERRGPDHNPWSSGGNLICSMQYARLDRNREAIAAAQWDLVIVDEAHHARRHSESGSNKGYLLLEGLRDRVPGLLLLTATPMQLHDYELYSMIELVSPGLFSGYLEFRNARGELRRLNEHMAWLMRPASDRDRPPELAAYLQEIGAPNDIVVLRPDRPEERAKLIAWSEEHHRLSEALVRNRKAEVGGFTQRLARRIPVHPTDAEQDLEAAVQEYIRRTYRASPAAGLVLVTFRKILTSSTDALAGAFDRRAERLLNREGSTEQLTDDMETAALVDDALDVPPVSDVDSEVAELRLLAKQARQTTDSKLEGLDRALRDVFSENPDEKVLIFTQFIGTLEMISKRLARHHNVVGFHGGMSIAEKDAAARAFKGDAQVMVSSEAGGEGRNFQFCHVLVNYDLPWNPMKVEQRIGRLDRVGQEKDVYIYNFELRGTLDQQILDVLDQRIQVFTETVGALDPILGDVEKQIERISLLDPEAAKEEFTRFELDLETRLHQARDREHKLRDFILDARSFRRDEVNSLLGTEPRATPADLKRFVEAVLSPYPTASITTSTESVSRVVLPPVLIERARQESGVRLRDSYEGTFDHRAAISREDVDFFAFGHPMIEGLIQFFTRELDVPLVRLDSADDAASGVLFDYRVRFNGVRSRDWLLSHLVAGEAVGSPPSLSVPAKIRSELRLDSSIEDQRTASRESANAVVSEEFVTFAEENERLLASERRRLDRLYDFQVAHVEGRISQNEELIRVWELFGSEDERRTIPARRGLVSRDRERIARLEEERDEAIRTLELKRVPTREIGLVGTTLVG